MTPRQIRAERAGNYAIVWCAQCGGREMVFTPAAEQAWIASHLTNVHNDTRKVTSILAKRRSRATDE